MKLRENPIYYLEREIGKNKSMILYEEINKFNPNDRIDTLSLAARLNLSKSEMFKAMISLRNSNIVNSYHELTCPKCKFKKSYIYKDLAEYSHGVSCDVCRKELTAKDSRYVFTKKGELQ